uniref:non-specific serine/threonine protein kinase n=1 Tax=Ditylenchus dipsaci TaxID=166011 RepID=A0A915CUM0_9BILA
MLPTFSRQHSTPCPSFNKQALQEVNIARSNSNSGGGGTMASKLIDNIGQKPDNNGTDSRYQEIGIEKKSIFKKEESKSKEVQRARQQRLIGIHSEPSSFGTESSNSSTEETSEELLSDSVGSESSKSKDSGSARTTRLNSVASGDPPPRRPSKVSASNQLYRQATVSAALASSSGPAQQHDHPNVPLLRLICCMAMRVVQLEGPETHHRLPPILPLLPGLSQLITNGDKNRYRRSNPLAKAPTLQCTSSEDGSDSPHILPRTVSVQSLPPSSNINKGPLSPSFEIESLYHRTLHLLANDIGHQKEIALGKRIGFYRLGKELGSGNFSKVKLGVHVLTKEKVAIKAMEKSKMDQKAQRLLAREIDNMELMHHPNIIRLFECVETLSKVYLVMEYAGCGELYTYVHDNGKLTEEIAKPIFAQLVSAVAHLHSKEISHRDIKAENVIFSQPGWVKLADFGFSCKYGGTYLNTFCGSPPYAAPELFRDQNYDAPMVDIWALGCCYISC